MYGLESKDATLNQLDRVEVEQLDYCNAFVRICYLLGNDTEPTRVEMVSYCTPVVAIEYGADGMTLECAPAATCSVTTRKHVCRFLSCYGSIWSYSMIKTALNAKFPDKTPYRYITERGEYGPRVDPFGLFGVRYSPVKPFNNGIYMIK